MTLLFLPTTEQIGDLFRQEISDLGGTVSDVFDDGRRLFLRSILPGFREVRSGDRVQGGVALRVTDHQVLVHPYIFRQVCRNGAIMAQALQTRRLDRVEQEDFLGTTEAVEEVLSELGEAVRLCGAEEAFAAGTEQLRTAVETEAEGFLNLMPLVSRVAPELRAELIHHILDQFTADRDRTVFGLMNAVTSVARDTRDPDLRWRLEELGGGIPALRFPSREPSGAAAVALHA
jgi:hypothetical protein